LRAPTVFARLKIFVEDPPVRAWSALFSRRNIHDLMFQATSLRFGASRLDGLD
jgi:hypothetical protein